jgi:membrane fusion protein (multidrug efflux system)
MPVFKNRQENYMLTKNLTRLLRNIIPAAAVIVFYLQLSGCSDNKQAAAGGFSMPPMPVETANVAMQSVADRFEAVGTVEAIEEVTVVSEIDATVLKLPFEEGGYVKKGDLIAQLDDAQLAAEVARTEALYKQNQSAYNRVKSVVDNNAGTPQELDNAYANMKIAEANMTLAKARLSKTRITAPFSGTVGARQISTGTFLRIAEPITTLANLSEIRIKFAAPERFLANLKRGGKVEITSPVYPDTKLTGTIIAIEPVLNDQTRSAEVVARVANPGQKFRPGMSANIAAVLSERSEALTVPSEAIFALQGQSFVYVVQPDSTVKQVPVSTGLQLVNAVEVLSGLERGMKIIKAGHQKLFPGAKVMPMGSTDVSLAK